MDMASKIFSAKGELSGADVKKSVILGRGGEIRTSDLLFPKLSKRGWNVIKINVCGGIVHRGTRGYHMDLLQHYCTTRPGCPRDLMMLGGFPTIEKTVTIFQ
jgi:hypothetical protein